VRIDGYTADLAGDPLVRQRLRPERVGLEHRHLARLRVQADLKVRPYDDEKRDARADQQHKQTVWELKVGSRDFHVHTHP